MSCHHGLDWDDDVSFCSDSVRITERTNERTNERTIGRTFAVACPVGLYIPLYVVWGVFLTASLYSYG